MEPTKCRACGLQRDPCSMAKLERVSGMCVDCASIHLAGTVDECLEVIRDLVEQHCRRDDNGLFDTGALTANADAFHLLAEHGWMALEEDGYGRRWFGKLTEQAGDANVQTTGD